MVLAELLRLLSRLLGSFPSSFTDSCFFQFACGCTIRKGTSHILRRRSLHVVPLSDEETESDYAGLRPRKVRKTVSIAKLVGGIGDVLGDKFSVPGQK